MTNQQSEMLTLTQPAIATSRSLRKTAPLALVAMAVAVALFIAYGLAVPAEAQSSRGAITGLTLTSDAPGTLTVSWDTASPTPTDYRVDWAKIDRRVQVMEGRRRTCLPDSRNRHDHHHHGPKPRHRVQDPHACSLLQRRAHGQILGWPMGDRHHHSGRRTGGDAHP